MHYVKRCKFDGESLILETGVEDEDTPGTSSLFVVPVAAVASRAALLGVGYADALAALLADDGSVDWSGLMAELGVEGDTPRRVEARRRLGVVPGLGLGASPAVQLQGGRVEAIAVTLEQAPPLDTDMTVEDIAQAVQVGDLHGKLGRALEARPDVLAEVEGAVAQAREGASS